MEYEISLLTIMGIAIIGALSLNLIVGFCGQISLGHGAFIGTGAYTSALLTGAGISFWIALPAGMFLAGILGIIVGFASLRVRDDFLAITTMGVVFLFLGIVRKQDFLGGEMGIAMIPDPGLGKLGYMIFVLSLALALALFSLYLKRSWMGFAFDAIADDEDTAGLVGINSARYKLIAFGLGTCFAGLSGVLYAHNVRFIDPESFGFVESITVLSMVVIGGTGSVWGVTVAAAILSIFPMWFQFIDDYKLLVYGGLLCTIMLFSPDGLSGIAGRIFSKAGRRKTDASG
ncbi:branched-chain amino acid ABC transporter permease [Desulfomarina profundi]|uniref:Branched-chain amino acid ABC transporter permease n=1 Tax=Desulfomarina profundi TaxID=2772557 RepID=A0A8D5FL75_9BACT|nr:branched-chain amino acid ABC transporter permease [Desulfomarina profundi]BCL61043.1 branched-chain amino acid ABC transporter permease [Desulfomarina profundi]